jgi:hypothetical protein
MSALKRTRAYAIAALLFSVFIPLAHADGLDPKYFVRFDSLDHSWTYFGVVLSLIMIANYVLNFAVIGLPAMCWASVHAKTVALGLVILTILGQIADRIGSIVGLFVAMPIAAIASPFVSSARRGLVDGVLGYSIVAGNLICSGIAVGGLALWFLRRRWSVSKSLSWKIALAAAVLTNPAWILFFRI